MTTTLIRPVEFDAPLEPDAAYDLSAGRCAIDVVFAPLRLPVWRVRLRAVAIRLTDRGCGRQWLVATLAVQPRFASLPFSTGLFMPATDRSDLLTVTAELPALERGETVSADGSISCGERDWPVSLQVRCVEADDTRVIAAISGAVARRDDLPFPTQRLRVDAAVELVRCA
jgi:hypothetical protein